MNRYSNLSCYRTVTIAVHRKVCRVYAWISKLSTPVDKIMHNSEKALITWQNGGFRSNLRRFLRVSGKFSRLVRRVNKGWNRAV